MTQEDWIRRVHEVGCVLCHHRGRGWKASSAHHCREGQGKDQKATDWLAIALCYECHQGPSGWHGLGKRAFYQRFKLDEMDLLSMTIQAVAKGL